MSKREEIDSLRATVLRLIERIETLEANAAMLPADAAHQKLNINGHYFSPNKGACETGPFSAEVQKSVQDAWDARHNGLAAHQPPKIKDHTKGPLPYAHKTGHAGKMTVGESEI